MIMPMPIFLPISNDNSAYEYPEWVTYLAAISLAVLILGVILLVINLILEIIDINPDWLFNTTVIVLIIGVMLLFMSVIIMAITGVKIE